MGSLVADGLPASKKQDDMIVLELGDVPSHIEALDLVLVITVKT